ncbi:MAG: hypothetical protein QOF02_3733 [Blastocatellia bacterium]|nr:hypothetical protein [Blastocatellia bacterium]
MTMNASTQAPAPGGWTPVSYTIKVDKPWNVPLAERYTLSDGTHHLWVKSTDQPYNQPPYPHNHKTLPRTEQRFWLDDQEYYTSGQWKYESQMKAPQGSSGMCLMQIHTGMDDEAKFGSTAFMLFWQEAHGGSLNYYDEKVLATDLTGKWFDLQVLHTLPAHTVAVALNGQLIWSGQQYKKSAGAKSYFMKDGVYMQEGGSPTMEVSIKSIKFSQQP